MASLTYIEARKEHVEAVVVHKHLTVAWCLIYSAHVQSVTRRQHTSQQVKTTPITFSSYSDRTFAATRARLWNSLQIQLCNPDISYERFKRQLKGHLFGESGTR